MTTREELVRELRERPVFVRACAKAGHEFMRVVSKDNHEPFEQLAEQERNMSVLLTETILRSGTRSGTELLRDKGMLYCASEAKRLEMNAFVVGVNQVADVLTDACVWL